MRVALVYDRINKVGGAEQVLKAFHDLYPDADWYTSVWDPALAPFSAEWDVHASWLNHIPLLRRHHEWIPYLMPFVFESFDFSSYDLVVSIGSAESKGVLTKPGTVHINYCLTPTRYLYSHSGEYLSNPLFRQIGNILRSWDRVAAMRTDYMISISEQVKIRVQKYYNRDSDVIYPPVDIKKFRVVLDHRITCLPDNFYLIVSRLVPYKHIEIAIDACNRTKRNLVIVGTGSELIRLKKLSGPTVTFAGFVSDHDLPYYFASCRAYIQCNEEDFGIAMVEALAAGKPVVAYRQGGAREIVTKATGVLYNELSVDSLIGALKECEKRSFGVEACRHNATRFEVDAWKRQMKERITTLCQNQEN